MPSIDTCLGRVAAPRGVVDHDGDGRIRQFQLAGEAGFRHAGHADERRAVPLHPVDLGGGLEPRPRHRAVDTAVDERNGRRARRGEAALAKMLGIRMREVDVDHTLIAAVEERRFAVARVVDELMRQHEIARGRARMAPTEATAMIVVAPRCFNAHRFAR